VIAKIMMAAFCALAVTAHAADVNYPALKGIDLTPAVNYLKRYVRVTSHPVYTWNWFNAKGHSDMWAGNFAADDGMGLTHVQNSIPLFWNSYCTGDGGKDPADCPHNKKSLDYGGGNTYGPGLYLALDPAITQEFGVDKGADWVLLQVKLPKGTRLINTMSSISNHTPPQAVMDVFIKLGCEVHWSNALDSLLALTGDRNSSSTPAACLLGVRKIFKDILKIDGFVYPYEAITYPECGNADNHAVAIVMTSDRVFDNPASGAEVLAFNNKSTDHVEDRVRITSMFLYAVQMNADKMYDKIALYNISRAGFPGHPGKDVYTIAPQDGGKYTAELCPRTGDMDCDHNVDVPASFMQAFPTTLSGKYPTPGYEGEGPMWPDLDGQPTTPDLKAWITKNLFSCAQPSDYQ